MLAFVSTCIGMSQKQDDPFVECPKEYAVNHAESPSVIFAVATWVFRDDFAKEYPMRKAAEAQRLA